jgi:hypothetical protein
MTIGTYKSGYKDISIFERKKFILKNKIFASTPALQFMQKTKKRGRPVNEKRAAIATLYPQLFITFYYTYLY